MSRSRATVHALACAMLVACGASTDLDVASLSASATDAGRQVTPALRALDGSYVPPDGDVLSASSDGATEGSNPGSPDDLLYASPSFVFAPEGSLGYTMVVAAGPWASGAAPPLALSVDGTTLSLGDVFFVRDPDRLEFNVPTGSVGQRGTITVTGSAGGVTRSTTVEVAVTACAPWSTEFACNGAVCGIAEDGCGGTLSCGACEGATPYCFAGAECISCAPYICGGSESFDPATCKCRHCGCKVVGELCVCSVGPPAGFPG